MSQSFQPIIDNILADGPQYVVNRREDLLPFLQDASRRVADAGVQCSRLADLVFGVERAPEGQKVYHERLLLLEVLDALDLVEAQAAEGEE